MEVKGCVSEWACQCGCVNMFPRYSKEEGLIPPADASLKSATPSPKLLDFTFLLISAGDFPLFTDTHHIVGRSEGFSHLSLDLGAFPPLQIAVKEAVLVLVRNSHASTCRAGSS